MHMHYNTYHRGCKSSHKDLWQSKTFVIEVINAEKGVQLFATPIMLFSVVIVVLLSNFKKGSLD